MKCQYVFKPQCGKMVRQRVTVVTFVHDLCLGYSGDSSKGLAKEHSSENIIHHAFGYVLP